MDRSEIYDKALARLEEAKTAIEAMAKCDREDNRDELYRVIGSLPERTEDLLLHLGVLMETDGSDG
jgi:hypothetical protein